MVINLKINVVIKTHTQSKSRRNKSEMPILSY
jgi:hypothetical protein